MKRTGFTKKPTKPMKRTSFKSKAPSIASKAPRKPVVKSKPKKAQKTQAWLKKELDRQFSIYIRTKFSDKDGNNKCYTCGKAGTIKTMQCGHYVSRQYLATRWDENNCRIQCAGCNLFGNGKPLDFEENLKKELGAEYVEVMKKKRHISLKLDRAWYIDKIADFKEFIHTLAFN